MSTAPATATATSSRIDPRGPRLTAAFTALVLVAVLLTAPAPIGIVLLTAQAALFAVGAAFGVQRGPWSLVFRTVVRPRLAAPSYLEDATPPRFAQGVGLIFAVVALGGYLGGSGLLGAVATGLALLAALLNAVFGLCLGCEIYLLLRRVRPSRRPHQAPAGKAGAAAPKTSEKSPENNEKVSA